MSLALVSYWILTTILFRQDLQIYDIADTTLNRHNSYY